MSNKTYIIILIFINNLCDHYLEGAIRKTNSNKKYKINFLKKNIKDLMKRFSKLFLLEMV